MQKLTKISELLIKSLQAIGKNIRDTSDRKLKPELQLVMLKDTEDLSFHCFYWHMQD